MQNSRKGGALSTGRRIPGVYLSFYYLYYPLNKLNTVTMRTYNTSLGSDLYPPLFIDRPGTKRNPGRNKPTTPYHTSNWSRLSCEFRQSSPDCQECKKQGIVTRAEYTTHRIPWPGCDFWKRENWVNLCRIHYREKRRRDKSQGRGSR